MAKVKVGVFGGRRGATMVDVLSRHPNAELVAICDGDPAALEQARHKIAHDDARVVMYHDFESFINHDMNAVVLANYATEHAPFAIKLLDSGRHVVSEVLACQTLAEAVALVEAVERSGKVYSYAENYCYFRGTMEMQRLYRNGDIGEFLHGEGEYVHDCESIWADITRGQKNHWRNWIPSTYYCTHAIGPLLTITNTRPVRISAYETPNVNKRKFGCRSGDGSVIVCQMDNGATAKFIPWANYRRHPESIWYAVYGSKGMMETDRWGSSYNRLNVYIEGDDGAMMERSYHPRSHLETKLARSIGGHGGSDFYTMHFFLDAILDRPGKEYAIGVYQALDMTLPGILAYRSIWEGNRPIDVPDFRNKDQRDRYRADHWSVDPKLAGQGQPDASCSHHQEVIDDDVYTRQQQSAGVSAV